MSKKLRFSYYSVALFALVLLTTFNAQAQIQGEVSGIWTAAESPICVTGDIVLPADKTLTIEPGVEVVFHGNYAFNIDGALNATGTAQNWISFVPVDTEEGWGGIRISGLPTDTLQFAYCYIAYARQTSPNKTGGGMFVGCKYIALDHCWFDHNYVQTHGGGMQITNNLSDAYCTIKNCIFSFNTAIDDGGGIATMHGHNIVIENSLIYGNSAGDKGGAVGGGGIRFHGYGSPVVKNCVVTNNYCVSGGAGISSYWNTNPIIANSIIWGNNGDNLWESSPPVVSYCCVQGGWPGTGNISTNPQFIDETINNFALMPSSPCIDSGNPDLYSATDILGFARPAGNYPDMGIYETSASYFGILLFPQLNTCASACNGFIDAIVTGGTEPYDLVWSDGSTGAQLYDVCPNEYTLTATDAAGLVATYTFTMDYILPNPQAFFTTNSTQQCLQNNSFSLQNQSTINCLGTLKYNWTYGDGFDSDAENPIYHYTTPGNYNIALTATSNEFGCSNTYTMPVTVAQPTLDLGPDTALCAPDVLLYDLSQTPADSYLWSNNSANPILYIDTQGVYWLTIQWQGCTTTDTLVVANNCKPILPVELLYFSGFAQATTNELSWATASETNTQRFEVYASSNGHNFTLLGQVPAHQNSSTQQLYSLTHAYPPVNTYYQLRDVTTEGITQILQTIFIDRKNTLTATNNTSGWDLTANTDAKARLGQTISLSNYTQQSLRVLIKIYTIDGRLVVNNLINVEPGQQNLDLPFLANTLPGYYFITATDGQTNPKTIKWIAH